MTSPIETNNVVERLRRWSGQGGEAHKLMVVLACAARHECDIDEPEGPAEFIELDASVADTLNALLGDLRDTDLQSLSDRIDVLEDRAVELVMAGNAWPQHTITADEAAFEVASLTQDRK